MSKNKLQKFAEMKTFHNVLQPPVKGLIQEDYFLKGLWNEKVFENNNPIVLELGCGKGEYTVGLAQRYPDKNFIGVDIKGARIWKGAKTAIELGLKNVYFLRTKVDFIDKFFAEDEISEIWIPHPDPQPKKPRKRLTSSHFLKLYQKIIKNDAIIHLKTDNYNLHIYTRDLLAANGIEPIESYEDIYAENLNNEITEIKTFYEKMFLSEGTKITYVSFRLDKRTNILQPPKRQVQGYKY